MKGDRIGRGRRHRKKERINAAIPETCPKVVIGDVFVVCGQICFDGINGATSRGDDLQFVAR